MLLDVFIMPAAPPPPANNVNNAPAGESAVLTLDRPAQAADQKKSFIATLNRVSAHQSCGHKPSHASKTPTTDTACPNTEPTQSANSGKLVDQDAIQDQAVPSAVFPPTQASALVCDGPVKDLIHTFFMQMGLADDGSIMVEGPSDSNSDSAPAVLNQLMRNLQSPGHLTFAGQVGTESFEQLQINISPEANNLAFVKQLVNRALVQPLAADPSGPQSNQSVFEYWRSLAAAPADGVPLGAQTQALATRIDALIHFLGQRYDQLSAAADLAAATVEGNGKQAAVNADTLKAHENLLLQKLTNTVKPTEAQVADMSQTAAAEKNNHPPVGAPKDLSVEFLLQPRYPKDGEHSQAVSSQPASKITEPAINSNIAAHSVAAKPTEDALNFKPSSVHNDLLVTDQTGRSLMQIDGEAKDSSFFASQDNPPDHLTKLEHAGRSAASAQSSLASQTMNQIVQKAVLLNHNGQSTVQIDLKPEFLGHIRMQIVTESQQVAVRIVAEFPMVKEMLESNLNQLKAELQAQGLEVDELEVSVAHDSRADDDPYQKAAEARRARALKNNRLTAESATEDPNNMQATSGRSMTETAIDFFA